MVKKIPILRKKLIELMVDYIKTRDTSSSRISTTEYNRILGQKNKQLMQTILTHNQEITKKIDDCSGFSTQDRNTAKKQLAISYDGLLTELRRRHGKIGVQAALRLGLLDNDARERLFDRLEATEIDEKKVHIMDVLLTMDNPSQKDKRKLLQARDVTLLFEKKTLRKSYLSSLEMGLKNFEKIKDKRMTEDREFVRTQLKRVFKERLLKNALNNKKPSGTDVKTMKTVLTKGEISRLVKEGDKLCSGFKATVENA